MSIPLRSRVTYPAFEPITPVHESGTVSAAHRPGPSPDLSWRLPRSALRRTLTGDTDCCRRDILNSDASKRPSSARTVLQGYAGDIANTALDDNCSGRCGQPAQNLKLDIETAMCAMDTSRTAGKPLSLCKEICSSLGGAEVARA